MKRILIVFLLLALTACSAVNQQPPQQQQPPAPAATEAPTVAPTTAPAAPSDTPAAAPAATSAPAAPAATTAPGGSTAGDFTNITQSVNAVALVCTTIPGEVTFTATTSVPNTASVGFFYRMADKNTSIVSRWVGPTTMTSSGNGAYTITLNTRTVPDDMKYKQAWLEYEFVALSSAQARIGSSGIISQKLTFTLHCQ